MLVCPIGLIKYHHRAIGKITPECFYLLLHIVMRIGESLNHQRHIAIAVECLTKSSQNDVHRLPRKTRGDMQKSKALRQHFRRGRRCSVGNVIDRIPDHGNRHINTCILKKLSGLRGAHSDEVQSAIEGPSKHSWETRFLPMVVCQNPQVPSHPSYNRWPSVPERYIRCARHYI